MDQITCIYCGKPHDIEHIEPTLLRPDPILSVPKSKRGSWTSEGKDYAVLRPRRSFREWFTRPQMSPRYFLRVNMPFAVAGRDKPVAWGIWVEVSQRDYAAVHRLWDSSEQHLHPPIPARLANDIRDYPATSGLPGKLQLQNPSSVPVFTLEAGNHPLIAQQQHGVSEDTVMKWLEPILHPPAAA